jgi:kumamolisin
MKRNGVGRVLAGLGVGVLAAAGPLSAVAGASTPATTTAASTPTTTPATTATTTPTTTTPTTTTPTTTTPTTTTPTTTPVATPAVAAPAASTPAAPTPMAAISQGVEPASLPGSTVFGTTPPDTPEAVSFILRERNLPQLETAVDHGVRSFVSVPQFAATYGQSPAVIAALVSYLGRFGIKTQVYADDVDISATGTAGEFDAALAVTECNYHVPGHPGTDGTTAVPAQTVHGAAGTPELPASIAADVLAVFGLTNYAPFVSNTAHVDTAVAHPQSSSTSACVKLSGLPDACNLPSNFTADYGLNPVTQTGADGAGETLAIVTLATLDPGAPQYFWSHIAGVPTTGRTLTTEDIDGGAGAPSDAAGSGETDLDVEQSGSVAPGANVIVYEAPNTDAGFADGFFTAASQNVASTVSASWGESETYVQAAVASGAETPAYEAAYDEAFLEMADQGQSGFLSAGDSGAYDASGDLGTTNLSVDTSADSPYMTSSGGTTLAWSGTLTGTAGSAKVSVPAQRAWGWDYLWPAMAATTGQSLAATAEANVVGGGGGFSALEPTPSYQQGVPGTSTYDGVEYLTPTDVQNVDGILEPTLWSFNPAPRIIRGAGTGRAEPDLSTDADPFSGYLLYEPSFAGIGEPTLQGGWGGTSFVAPQLNGSAAVIDSYLGHRVGLWNPALYSLASTSATPFTQLQTPGTSNDNVFYTGQPGALYNQATGLGYPNLSVLARDLRAW